MAKKTKAELKEDLKAAKEELKVARTEKRDFEKSNKLEKDADHSGNEKSGKRWTKLNDMVVKKQAAVDKIQVAIDEAAPEATVRAVKYDYPEDVVTALDKKKYRAAQRAAKKKAEKEANGSAKESKSSKKAAKEESTEAAGEVKSSKKSKKSKAPKVEED